MQNESFTSLFNEHIISFDYIATSKEDAICEAGRLMLKQKMIEQEYIDAMLDNCAKLGPYFVLLPGLAMPHASCASGVNKLGISIVKLKNSVNFNHEENDPVKLIIALATPDNQSHMSLLSFLSSILLNEQVLTELKESKSKQEMLDIFQRELKRGRI